MLKVLFWLFVVIDVVALVIFAVLGFAAAKPSHTNPIAALIVPFVIPAAILVGAMILFFKVPTVPARSLAVFIAALPMWWVLGSAASSFWELRGFRDASSDIREFRSQELRDIESAVLRNDAAAVTALASKSDLDTPGISGATVLVLALRQLDKTPGQLDVVKALLAAGADPNATGAEPPLQIAISASRESGIEPVQLLLDSGANPNARDEWGKPVFFIAGGQNINVEVMELLLARGADVTARSEKDESAVVTAAQTRNWPVLELLLKSRTPWRDHEAIQGVPFLDYMEREERDSPSAWWKKERLAEVMAILRSEGS